jgi:hypothetical protein
MTPPSASRSLVAWSRLVSWPGLVASMMTPTLSGHPEQTPLLLSDRSSCVSKLPPPPTAALENGESIDREEPEISSA